MTPTLTIVLMSWFLGNLGIHLVTPSLPHMVAALSSTSQSLQLVISLFLLGKAIGVLIWGPLAEFYGRRVILLSGLMLYITASITSAFSSTIPFILLARLLQGFAVSATVLMGRTIINDLFSQQKAVQAFACLFTIAGIIIALLPMVGAVIASKYWWQLAFIVMAIYSSILFALSFFLLDETRPYPSQSMTLSSIINDYSTVLSHPLFITYLVISALMVAGESCFNTSAAFILISTHGLSIKSYGAIKTTLALAHLVGSAVCVKLAKHLQINQLIAVGIFSFVIGSSAMVIGNLVHLPLTYALLLPMLIYYFGTGFIVASISSAVVRPFPKKMATAMAFCIFLQFITSSIFSLLSSVLNIHTTLPLSMMIFLVSFLSLVLWLSMLSSANHYQLS